MTASTSTVTAGGALVGAPGRPALTPAEEARRAARPNPARNRAYWARIDACVDAAPPLSAEQRLTIRVAFSTVTTSTQEAT